MSVCDTKPYTSGDKWTAAAISGLSFLAISSPYTYSLTNKAAEAVGVTIADEHGCPNVTGLLSHALVYTLVTRVLMERSKNGCRKPYTNKDKWVVSAMGGLLFLVVSSPFLYETVNSLTSKLGLEISSDDGCPNVAGLAIHTAIFTIVSRLLMR